MFCLIKIFPILLFVAAVIVAAETDDDDLIDDRIVGGVEVKIVHRSFQVAVIRSLKHCGGSIIHRLYILTAAHCTNGYVAENFRIRAASNFYYTGGVVRGIEKIYQHADFHPISLINDIAILQMITELPLGPKIDVIPLLREVPPPGTEVIVSGYGITEANGQHSNSLMQVNVFMIDWNECYKSYKKNNLTQIMQICASGEGKDSCQGDSGGPLTYNDLLLGVVSYGTSCADLLFPGVYSSVPYFYDWIEQYVPLETNDIQI